MVDPSLRSPVDWCGVIRQDKRVRLICVEHPTPPASLSSPQRLPHMETLCWKQPIVFPPAEGRAEPVAAGLCLDEAFPSEERGSGSPAHSRVQPDEGSTGVGCLEVCLFDRTGGRQTEVMKERGVDSPVG